MYRQRHHVGTRSVFHATLFDYTNLTVSIVWRFSLHDKKWPVNSTFVFTMLFLTVIHLGVILFGLVSDMQADTTVGLPLSLFSVIGDPNFRPTFDDGGCLVLPSRKCRLHILGSLTSFKSSSDNCRFLNHSCRSVAFFGNSDKWNTAVLRLGQTTHLALVRHLNSLDLQVGTKTVRTSICRQGRTRTYATLVLPRLSSLVLVSIGHEPPCS